MRRSSMGPLGGGPGRRRRPKLVTAHHKTYVGDTSETSSQTPSSTPAFRYCRNYGAAAPTRTGRGNQVTASSDRNYCPNYCEASRANKFRASSRSRPDSGWALLGAQRNFARGRFLNGRPAPPSQVAQELAERQRSRSQWLDALRRANSRPADRIIRRMRPQHRLRPLSFVAAPTHWESQVRHGPGLHPATGRSTRVAESRSSGCGFLCIFPADELSFLLFSRSLRSRTSYTSSEERPIPTSS